MHPAAQAALSAAFARPLVLLGLVDVPEVQAGQVEYVYSGRVPDHQVYLIARVEWPTVPMFSDQVMVTIGQGLWPAARCWVLRVAYERTQIGLRLAPRERFEPGVARIWGWVFGPGAEDAVTFSGLRDLP